MAWETSLFHIIALFAVSFLTRTDGILTSVPNNMVIKLGHRVEFECNTNETVPDSTGLHTYGAGEANPPEWTFLSPSSSAEEFIYRSGYVPHNFSSKYTIISDTKQGICKLVIDYVDLSFAGTYTCIESPPEDKEPHIASAELLVIASDPVCSNNASSITRKDDYISMWCTVNYSGNWIPLMEWTSNNGQNVHADISYTNSSMSLASMLITQLDVNDGEVTFTCKTSFKSMTTNIRTTVQGVVPAANVPNYQHFWNYTATVSLGSSTTHTPALNDGLHVCAIIGIVLGGVILSIAIVTIIYKLRKRGNAQPNIGHEVYSSLQRDQSDSFAQRDVYAKLQIYANINFKET